MRCLRYILLFFFLYNFNSSNAQQNDLEIKITKNLRCLVCQGQSISDSNSDFAQTLKSVVRDKIDEGRTENEIYSFLASKYGEWIIYKPAFNKINFILWSIPYLFLILGVFFIYRTIKK